MGAPEKNVINRVLSEMDAETERLFRINSGMGWVGEIVKHGGGIIILKNPRPLHAAPEGWPDLFGWKTVTITPDMVGMKVAVAHGIEIKAGAKNPSAKLRDQQRKFRDMLESMGGFFETVS